MQSFLDTTAPESGTEAVVTPRANGFVEVLHQSPDDPEIWFASYVVKVADGVTVAMTCWDERFDAGLARLADPRVGHIVAGEFRLLWPTFFLLLDNTAAGRHEDGALARLVDPDDGERKWFIAVLAGAGTEAQLPTSAVDDVVGLSLHVANESRHDLSTGQKARIAARVGASRVRPRKQVARPWEDRLDWLQALLGT